MRRLENRSTLRRIKRHQHGFRQNNQIAEKEIRRRLKQARRYIREFCVTEVELIELDSQAKCSNILDRPSNTAMRELRRLVRERDGCCCAICGSHHSVNIHHIKPKSMGGTYKLKNLMLLCHFHHLAVHNSSIEVEPKFNQKINHLRQVAGDTVNPRIMRGFLIISGKE